MPRDRTEEEISYGDYWQLAQRYRLLILVAGFLGAAAGTIVAYVQSPIPIYAATTIVHYDPTKGYEASEIARPELTDQDLSDQETVIRGLTVIGNIAKRLGRIPEDVPPSEYPQHLEDLLPLYTRIQLSMNRRRRTGIIEIRATGSSPGEAIEVANIVAEEYRAHNIKELRDSVESRRGFLREQLEKNNQQLNELQFELEKFRRLHPLAFVEPGAEGSYFSGVAMSRANEQQLAEKIRETRRQLALVRSGRPPSDVGLQEIVGAAGTARLHQLSGRHTQLTFDRNRLLTELTEAHPRVWQKTEQIEAVRAELEQELELILDAFVKQQEEEKERIAALEERSDEIPKLAMRGTRMIREIQTLENVAQQLRVELQGALLKAAGVTGRVEIVSPAVALDQPVNPPPYLQFGGLGFGAGLFVGFVLAFMVESTRFTRKTLHELETSLDLSLLGVNGVATSETLGTWLAHGRRFREGSPEWNRSLALSVLLAPRSPFAEAFRTLRANLQWRGTDRKAAFALTSPGPGQGTTTAATNLALSFAQAGQRVLLVETDPRNPGVSAILGIETQPGLSDLLLGSSEPRQAIRSVTDFVLGSLSLDEVLLGPGMDHLHVIPCGRPEPNFSELLGSRAFVEIVDSLREDFDVVVFDLPALRSSSDVLVVGKRAQVVVVVDPTQSRPGHVVDTVEQLRNAECEVVGFFANRMEIEEAAPAEREQAERSEA